MSTKKNLGCTRITNSRKKKGKLIRARRGLSMRRQKQQLRKKGRGEKTRAKTPDRGAVVQEEREHSFGHTPSMKKGEKNSGFRT